MSGLRVSARILPYLLLIAAIAFVATLRGDGPVRATSFNPVSTGSLADSTPGASSDATINFNIEKPDAQFNGVIAFTPEEFAAEERGNQCANKTDDDDDGLVNDGCPASGPAESGAECDNADDDDGDGLVNDGCPTKAPLGAIAAQLKATSTIGLIGLACNTVIDPSIATFNMMIASTDPADLLQDAYGKTAEGRNPGPADDQFDKVNGLPLGVTKYPDYLARILHDGNGTPLKPKIRLYGQILVSGFYVSLNFAQFEPGTTVRGAKLDPALGNPSVVVLINTGDPEAALSPIPITDFCTPLASTTTIYSTTKDNPDTAANEGGTVLTRNPATDGAYNSTLFAVSMPDADDDGIENFMDPCPFTATPAWDPRDAANPGDADEDGLPDECDPDPTTPDYDLDSDNDKYLNRGDNCPNDVNGLDPGPDGRYATADDIILGPNNQLDTDQDFIGDACDPNPAVKDGHQHNVCTVTTAQIGAGGTAPGVPNLCSEAAVGYDLNNNGIFDSLEASAGPTPTPGPGQTTPTPGPGGVGGPDSGIGTLSPTAASVPAWAAIAVGLGGAGLLGSLGALVSRRLRRRG